MCGRYTQTVGLEALKRRFRFEQPSFELLPRYNLAPSQEAPVVVEVEGKRRLAMFRWGLVPAWAKDPKIGYKLINARSETAAEKPSFRRSLAKRRCLVPADGFYEWKPVGPKLKWPMRIVLKSREPFAFAGLWDEWRDPNGKPLRSFTILTAEAPASVRPIHDRCPVILSPESEAVWLDPEAAVAKLAPIMVPPPDDALEAYPVAPLVNSPKADSPACIELSAPAEPSTPSSSPPSPLPRRGRGQGEGAKSEQGELF